MLLIILFLLSCLSLIFLIKKITDRFTAVRDILLGLLKAVVLSFLGKLILAAIGALLFVLVFLV